MAEKAKNKKSSKSVTDAQLIPIYIMGKRYDVPDTLTILRALEYAGYKQIRGCGCRGGICGACATIYRIGDDYRLQFGLACQTRVEPEMYLVQIPFVPANKAVYELEKTKPSLAGMGEIYPDLYRCLACNTCSKACPMGIQVMDYVQALLQGDIETAAKLSHGCTMCGICSLRCPAELRQFQIAMLARRLYGRYVQPKSKHLAKRIAQIRQGKFDRDMDELLSLEKPELEKRYREREWEPEDYEDSDWQPKETKYLIVD